MYNSIIRCESRINYESIYIHNLCYQRVVESHDNDLYFVEPIISLYVRHINKDCTVHSFALEHLQEAAFSIHILAGITQRRLAFQLKIRKYFNHHKVSSYWYWVAISELSLYGCKLKEQPGK